MTNSSAKPITNVVVHMYKMGTGDCFVLKFMTEEDKEPFKMMIDCGTWNREFDDIRPFIEKLKQDVNGHIHLLVVTHEHKDHVLGFQAGEQLLTSGFKVDRVWMSWAENDKDEDVKKWKKDHGEKKAALADAVNWLNNRSYKQRFKQQMEGAMHADEIMGERNRFADVLADFASLHVSDGEYKGGLRGMAVVKDVIADNNISYFKQGKIIENIKGLDGVRIYVLGPPDLWEQIRKESGKKGEAYKHNKDLENSALLANSFSGRGSAGPDDLYYPFKESYTTMRTDHRRPYYDESWRRIDFDWLFSSGVFALRMNSLTNNLSLALAFEFIDSGKVILFPGDAEFGSWESWHDSDWKDKGQDVTTEELLNRVVFYKVAHHLSHNGTARSLGLDMMIDEDLAAMATLNYDDICKGWTSTMPNRQILRDLLEKTKGRMMIMKEEGIFYDLDNQIPLSEKIVPARQKMSADERKRFEQAFSNEDEHYMEYIVTVGRS